MDEVFQHSSRRRKASGVKQTRKKTKPRINRKRLQLKREPFCLSELGRGWVADSGMPGLMGSRVQHRAENRSSR